MIATTTNIFSKAKPKIRPGRVCGSLQHSRPMSFLPSNISFGILLRKRAFRTRLYRIFTPCNWCRIFQSRIFHPRILFIHFPVLYFHPIGQSDALFSSPTISAPAFLTVPHFSMSHFRSPKETNTSLRELLAEANIGLMNIHQHPKLISLLGC